MATEADALARLAKIPESTEAISMRAMGQTWTEHRDNWIETTPTSGCVAKAPDCAWVISSGTAEKHDANTSQLAWVDRTFFVDARSGEVTAIYPEDWTDEDRALAKPKPLAEWKRLKERQKRAWAIVDKLAEVKSLRNLGYRTHPPAPYDCTSSDASPCKFAFDVCDVGRNAGCEAKSWDWVGRFTVDDSTRDVVVDADELTRADGGAVPLARWQILVDMLHKAKAAIEKTPCAGSHPSVVTVSGYKRNGCGAADPACSFELPVVLSMGEDAYSNAMTVDGKTFTVTVDTPSAVLTPMSLSQWCARVAQGLEPTNTGSPPAPRHTSPKAHR